MTVSDRQFVAALSVAVDRYFAAVDQWESAYCRCYRMPGSEATSADLAAEHREFEDRRRELVELLPRARFLCLRNDRPDVFAGLRHVSLGQYAPQERTSSAIGRSERNAVMASLMEFNAACREAEAGLPASPPPSITPPSLLERVVAFFL